MDEILASGTHNTDLSCVNSDKTTNTTSFDDSPADDSSNTHTVIEPKSVDKSGIPLHANNGESKSSSNMSDCQPLDKPDEIVECDDKNEGGENSTEKPHDADSTAEDLAQSIPENGKLLCE